VSEFNALIYWTRKDLEAEVERLIRERNTAYDQKAMLYTEVERLTEEVRMARPMYRESELGTSGYPSEQSWVISDRVYKALAGRENS
jgi:hypothetical protein